MTGEENKKNSADFSAQRNEFFMRQTMSNKLLPPRIQPITSAKAASEEAVVEETTTEKVEVDSEKTVKAVMEALETVGPEASKHLTKKDKDYIKSVCLKENDDTYMFLIYMTIAILVGYSVGSYMNKN